MRDEIFYLMKGYVETLEIQKELMNLIKEILVEMDPIRGRHLAAVVDEHIEGYSFHSSIPSLTYLKENHNACKEKYHDE
jgi:hypothetical protein